MPSEFFQNGVSVQFEDIVATVPTNYDSYIRHLYGDYMTPPHEKQVSYPTGNAMVYILPECWRTRSTGTGRRSHGAKIAVFNWPARHWAVPQRIRNRQTRTARRQEYQDICDRNIVEGEFGTGKRAYGLIRIMAHLPDTSFCVIGVAFLFLNLTKRLMALCLGLFAELLRYMYALRRVPSRICLIFGWLRRRLLINPTKKM